MERGESAGIETDVNSVGGRIFFLSDAREGRIHYSRRTRRKSKDRTERNGYLSLIGIVRRSRGGDSLECRSARNFGRRVYQGERARNPPSGTGASLVFKLQDS